MKPFRIPLAAALVLAVPLACPAERVKLPNDIHWVGAADTFKACCQQAYANAGLRLRELAKAEKPGTWCVVLDADETIICNVEFQKEITVTGTGHSSGAWDAWCNRAEATALPGAKEFCALARELGGKVVIITNREAPTKAATIKNLADLGFAVDVVLMREGPYARDRKKTARRNDVEKGEVKTLPEGTSLPPLKILMLCGDQIHDLYDEGEVSFEQAKDRFGRDLVIVPNPMYGDWTRKGAYVEVPSAKEAAEPAVSSGSGALTPAQAGGRMGETVVVEGTVSGVRVRMRGPDSLRFEGTDRDGLSIAVFNQEKFGDVKSTYEGKKIRVTGKVTAYRGAPQIRVNDPSQIELLKPPPAPEGPSAAPAPAPANATTGEKAQPAPAGIFEEVGVLQ